MRSYGPPSRRCCPVRRPSRWPRHPKAEIRRLAETTPPQRVAARTLGPVVARAARKSLEKAPGRLSYSPDQAVRNVGDGRPAAVGVGFQDRTGIGARRSGISLIYN